MFISTYTSEGKPNLINSRNQTWNYETEIGSNILENHCFHLKIFCSDLKTNRCFEIRPICTMYMCEKQDIYESRPEWTLNRMGKLAHRFLCVVSYDQLNKGHRKLHLEGLSWGRWDQVFPALKNCELWEYWRPSRLHRIPSENQDLKWKRISRRKWRQ